MLTSTLIQCHFDYASAIWYFGLTQTLKSKRQIVQNKIIRFILDLPARGHIYCAQFGRPDVIISDNGPQYTGEAFKRFTREWNINHTTSSPRCPQSNGFIERQVKYLKALIRKAMKCKEDIQLALPNVRATPLDANMPSPAELMFGRATTKLIPHRSEPGPVAQREWYVTQQTTADEKLL